MRPNINRYRTSLNKSPKPKSQQVILGDDKLDSAKQPDLPLMPLAPSRPTDLPLMDEPAKAKIQPDSKPLVEPVIRVVPESALPIAATPKRSIYGISKTRLAAIRIPNYNSSNYITITLTLVALIAYGLSFKHAPLHAGQTASSGQQNISADTSPGAAASSTTNLHSSSSAATKQISIGSSTQTSTTPAVGSKITSKASFTPVAPSSKPDLGQYAFAKTSYDANTGTYSYIDSISGGPFSVSERAMPAGYKSDQEAIDAIASSIKATQGIGTASGIAYMNQDPKSGQQTIVFSVKGLLLWINSNFKHTTQQWGTYINSLR